MATLQMALSDKNTFSEIVKKIDWLFYKLWMNKTKTKQNNHERNIIDEQENCE
jgi:hypothetical protein